MPHVPGMDAAGVLEQIGEGVVTDLKISDHVMAIVLPNGAHGAYAEQIVVPAESAARVPVGATDAEAASLPMNGLTARLALDLLGLAPNQTVAVSGAAGAVGGYAIQLAKTRRPAGDRRRGTARRSSRQGPGRRCRAAPGEGLSSTNSCGRTGRGGRFVDAALFDRLALPAVRDGGRIATLRWFSEPGERGITFIRFGYLSMPVSSPNLTVCGSRWRPVKSRCESRRSCRRNWPQKLTGYWRQAASEGG